MDIKLLFVADGRSPIAMNWIAHFVEAGYEVHLASTYPCSPGIQLASLTVIPVAFSQVEAAVPVSQGQGSARRTGTALRRVIPVGLRTVVRQRMGPLTLGRAARHLKTLISQIQPDLVHAMRIPFEGMLAALASEESAGPPLLISVWGNDFTLHAPSTPQMAGLTRMALSRAGALHSDCQRDVRLAYVWGYPSNQPVQVLPGGGGIQSEIFYPREENDPGTGISAGERGGGNSYVVNPRGFRAYVRNDTFFRAIPLILERRPETRFLCPAMQGVTQAETWVKELEVQAAVILLPAVQREGMGDLFRRSQVAVSPTTHDGTPNTLLEAMACGCFPVAGDLESLREWITPGVNGLLFDPGDPRGLADAVLLALEDADLRARARAYNLRLVADRAEHKQVMHSAEIFYQDILKNAHL